MRVLVCYPLDTFHRSIVLSKDPEAKNCPSGENIMVLIQELCPVSWMKQHIDKFSIFYIFAIFLVLIRFLGKYKKFQFFYINSRTYFSDFVNTP